MAYKTEVRKTTVSAAIGDAFSEFESLRDEMQDTVDNMSGANMEHLPKYETAEAAVSELDNHTDAPDVPDCVAELEVTYSEQVNKRKGRGPSRDVRLSNAQSMLSAAKDALEAFASSDDVERDEGEADEADTLVNELDEHTDFSVEFPGMFG